MTISFKYKPVKIKSGKVIHKPIIPLIINAKESIHTLGLLDSGSDITVIPKEIADEIGIEYKDYNEISGLTGLPIKSREVKIKVTFGKGHEIYSFEIPALVPLIKKDIPLIIGRAGFFDHFKITFIESEKRLEFKKTNSFNYK
ncbi:MAG: hypothetical protein AABX03_00870 [Nanoarchaeota archaeon]